MKKNTKKATIELRKLEHQSAKQTAEQFIDIYKMLKNAGIYEDCCAHIAEILVIHSRTT